MTESFFDLVKLFACGTHGKDFVPDHKIDAKQIFDHGKKQGIWTVAFPVLKKLYEAGYVDVTDEQMNAYESLFFGIAMNAAMRSETVYAAISSLEKQGIECCLLKGEVLSELYSDPSLRISSDTDILIDINKVSEQQVCKAMEKEGFETKHRPGTSHHAMCTHPVGGLVEFHLSLYDELFEDVWFNNMTVNEEPFRDFVTSGGHTYKTLGITDGAIFVSMHLIKHFLSEGVGVRQLMDTLLYLHHYKADINWDRYKNLMQELKFEKFISLCCHIGEKYLMFESGEFDHLKTGDFDEFAAEKLFEDMEAGGKFGHDDEWRKDFYKKYTQLRFSRYKTGDYDEYMKNWIHEKWYKRLFPPAKAIWNRYTYLKKCKLLLPVAWVQHLFDFAKRKTVADAEKMQITDTVAKERMELIDRLDMI